MDEDDRVKAIISWVMDNEPEDSFDSEDLLSRLEEMGYSSEEIRRAMLLLEVESKGEEILVDDGFVGGTRILSAVERSMLSLDAQGWLLWLRSTGWLSETHLGLIIESAGLEFRSPATLEEVVEIALRYVPSVPDGPEEAGYADIN